MWCRPQVVSPTLRPMSGSRDRRYSADPLHVVVEPAQEPPEVHPVALGPAGQDRSYGSMRAARTPFMRRLPSAASVTTIAAVLATGRFGFTKVLVAGIAIVGAAMLLAGLVSIVLFGHIMARSAGERVFRSRLNDGARTAEGTPEEAVSV
jgi:hypothetical protein